ncbi:MAG: hypothetical protein ABEI07_01845, partial [Candidatus Nanohaloarchaea archaeon]
ITRKKNYLFKVLSEKRVPVPDTVVVSTEKGLTGVEDEVGFPAVASTYTGFEKEGVEKVESLEELESVAERSEHGENFVLVRESMGGDVFESLYIDGETVSVKVESGEGEDNPKMNYHSLPSEKSGIVEEAAEAIGAELCRVRLEGEKVVEVSTDPDLQRFEELSGKNVYGKVSELLKGGDE